MDGQLTSMPIRMITEQSIFHPLVPGGKVPGDWYAGTVPANIETGANTVIDSSFCFKHFFSRLAPGMRVGNNVTLWRTALSTEASGFISIGDDCYISNASLVCSE